jgi:tRNA (cmo5U34)-methyltransferase
MPNDRQVVPMTNVKPEELNYSRYENDVYDSDIEAVIPGHRAMHDVIEQVVSKTTPKEVLELGVGTGTTAARILRQHPDAHYTANDFCPTMMEGAKRRLKGHNVDYLPGDFSQVPFGRQDLVVAVIGVHHQTHEGKKQLFRKVCDSLTPGGAFVFGDLMTFRDPQEAALNDAQHYAHLVNNARNETSLKEWAHHHKNLNILAPMEDQINWLRAAGFTRVDTEFRLHNTVLLCAYK